MADKKISELTSLAQGSIDADADVVAIVDTSATETKKATAEAVVLAALSQASAVTIPGTATINSTTIPNNKTLLVSTDVGSTVQAYDADTAKYDDVTANFTGTLQNGGSNVVVDSDIGSTVQAYDANTAKYNATTANFTGTLQNGGSNVLVDTDIGTNVQAYDADTAKYDDVTANFTGTLQNGGHTVLTDASDYLDSADIGVNVLAYDSNLQGFVDAFALPTVDGSANQVLKTDGAGNIGFASVTTSAAGSDTQIQYNSSGSFAGASGLVTDGSNLTINAQGDLRFADSDSSNWVAFQAPATIASNITWTLPSADGTNGQVLTTNGTGTLAWEDAGAVATVLTVTNRAGSSVSVGLTNGNLPVTNRAGSTINVPVS